MKSKMRTWNVAMGSLSLLFLCVSPALAIATNPSQENPYTEQNDDSVTQQRTRKVTGVVLDANGESIIGANVVVKGTNNGTITDLDGKFSIELSDGETLQVSFIGYNSKDVMVGAGENHIKVQLREDTQKLDEVVVVGYGTQIKRAVTGSVQSIKSEEMADMPVAQISQKMQGKFAGVQINQVSGKPGQGMTMRIRGQASLSGGTTPLYVVDGMPIVGDISTINPDEIESISVLKDASATSLYGSRAANGVVLIQTKTAQSGKKLSVDVYGGIQYVPEKGRPDMMDASEYARFRKEIAEENGLAVDPAYQHPEALGKGTDWYDVLFRPAAIQNYSLSYSNGDGKFKSSTVASYFNQDGVLTNSNYRRNHAPLCSGWNAYRGRYQHDQSRRDRKYQCAKRRFCHITLRFPGCQWSRIDTDKDCPIREKTKRRRIWRHTIRTREREAGYDGCLRIRTVQERDR